MKVLQKLVELSLSSDWFNVQTFSSNPETRRKSTDMRDLDDFLVPLSHGDFVWAQYGKYPSYPAIVSISVI